MADTKRKRRDDGNRGREKSKKNSNKQKSSNSRAQSKNGGRRRKSGPRLPSSLQKEIERLNPTAALNSDEDIASDHYIEGGEIYGKDVYELDEERAEEESQKNKRYDQVGVYKFEYELPDDLSEDFKDEDLESDDENLDDGDNWGTKDAKAMSDNSEEEDDGRHTRMLQGITGMPSEAFEERRKKRKDDVIPELYNPSHDIIDGDGLIGSDLLDPLLGKSGYSKLRKSMQQAGKNARTIHAPLPKADQAKVERKVAYELSKKDITKWEPIIKRNREAPTILFDENIDLGFSTVGAIASEFEPRTEFERKIAALVGDDELMEAHKKDGSRLLELNEISVEDEKERRNRIAKMRSLLFRHEMKAKHIKKIKSKTYHRLLKKDRIKAISAQIEVDPEAAKEFAVKQERLRAEERMTLKHKNQNQWAKRILARGLNNQDDGTRAAVAEQLRRHAELTRKMNSMKDSSSSSDDTSDDDDADENLAVSDRDRASKLLEKAKDKTMKVLEEEEDEVPDSGLPSLPFMRRALAKRREAAAEGAKLALQEYDNSLKNLENPSHSEDMKIASVSGRRVFGTAKSQTPAANDKIKSDNFYGSSDSEDGLEARENGDMVNDRSNNLQNVVMSDPVLIQEDTDTHEDSVFKNFNEIIKDPGHKTTYEVAIFASDTWKKAKNKSDKDADNKKSLTLTGPVRQELKDAEKESEEVSDTDSEGHMVDGILSSGSKLQYKLPSQEELIRQAFACDDVEDDFEKDKQDILNEENPEPEKPLLVPGWGQWTDIQQKKGLPPWMLKEHDIAKEKREEALKKRKDAHLKHVIISEKVDKKAEKLHTKALPYPFTSQEVFDQSLRMPIGPEFNPATAAGALNRPEVVKRPGVIIKPIEFEDPLEKTGRGVEKPKLKNKGSGGKTMKKTKTNRRVKV
ncbi:uncharacterized protein C57A7.06-like isoform X1 [Neltuma alba]|uniref:uncharacterized protein C57A7.06-like isoform X1 n=2 Tax=Neltuma alba TaxID=207710 RepID=UPI0010A56262|nr:uncharacterized protein C57A7.06-like isoform X1 [Prosopis alba]